MRSGRLFLSFKVCIQTQLESLSFFRSFAETVGVTEHSSHGVVNVLTSVSLVHVDVTTNTRTKIMTGPYCHLQETTLGNLVGSRSQGVHLNTGQMSLIIYPSFNGLSSKVFGFKSPETWNLKPFTSTLIDTTFM